MITSFLKTWLRNIYKERILSFVMAVALIAGLTTLTLISVYLHYQYSFDNFHKNPDRIYRVLTDFMSNNNVFELSLAKYKDALNNTPGIESSTKLFKNNNMEVEAGGKKYIVDKALYADQGFFKVFSFNLIAGDINKQLGNPYEAVLTKSLARKMWGSDNAIGKTFSFRNKEYVVNGVVEDTPLNSSVRFDALFSFSSESEMFKMFLHEFYTYFRINKNAGINETLIRANDACMNAYMENETKGRGKISLIFQPILDQHLKSEQLAANLSVPANSGMISILMIIGICTLVILVMNMIVLITAKSQGRFREIGIRKINGASIKNLILQLIGESVLFNIIIALIAIIAVSATIKHFAEFFDVDLSAYSEKHIALGFLLLAAGIIIGLLASAIPVYQLIKDAKPVSLISRSNPRKRNRLMYTTVFVQYAIVSGLITALFAFSGQVDYLKNKDLGFNKNRMAYFNVPENLPYQPFLNELKKIKGIEKAAGSDAIPGTRFSGMSLARTDQSGNNYVSAAEDRVQKEFIDTYGLILIAGRNFSETNELEKDNIILNEAAVKMLGYTPETIINNKVIHTHGPKTVIGVVKNYNFRTLHDEIGPIILSNYQTRVFTYSLLINSNDLVTLTANINEVIGRFKPGQKAEVAMLSDVWNNMYKADEKQITLVFFITILCVILSIIGLVALASYSIMKRTKEIGIRKVYGASATEILSMLYKNFIRLVFTANIVIIPLTYYLVTDWLNNFHYHLELGAVYFLKAILVVMIVTLATVHYFASKAAAKNPVDAIKYE